MSKRAPKGLSAEYRAYLGVCVRKLDDGPETEKMYRIGVKDGMRFANNGIDPQTGVPRTLVRQTPPKHQAPRRRRSKRR